MVTRDRDDETGRFTEEYPQKRFEEAITAVEPATTSKVAEYVGCSYDLAYRRLTDLETDGEVTKTEVGNSFVWNLE